MNYILYNPKANNENNDLTVIPGVEDLEAMGAKKINLIGLDVPAFCESLQEDDRVLICGGDGTLHHFANNAYGLEFPCPVCAVRSGTGNDFLNDIGQTNNTDQVDIRPYLKDLPAVYVNGQIRRCINGAGLGVDGAVCRGVEEFKAKTNKKKANYTMIALKELAYNYKRPNARVIVDGVVHEYTKTWAVSVMKGKYFGGGMMIAPDQDRTSGKLGAMMFHGGTRAKILAVLPTIYKGNHVKFKKIVEMFECDEIYVEFDIPTALQIDGETVVGVTSYTARTAKKHLEYLDSVASACIEE